MKKALFLESVMIAFNVIYGCYQFYQGHQESAIFFVAWAILLFVANCFFVLLDIREMQNDLWDWTFSADNFERAALRKLNDIQDNVNPKNAYNNIVEFIDKDMNKSK